MTADDKYKLFDTTPSGDIKIKGYVFRKRELILVLAVFVLFLVCLSLVVCLSLLKPKAGRLGVCLSVGCLEGASDMRKSMDTSVDPCIDFYSYACGAWNTSTKIPTSSGQRSVYGDIYRDNWYRVARILTSGKQFTSTAERKLRNLFKTCTSDYENMKSRGYPFINNVLKAVGGWYVFGSLTNKWDFQEALRKVHVDFWTDAIFTYWPHADPKNPKKTLISVDQSGLGMYYRNYFLNETEKERDAYKTFMRTIAELLIRDSNLTIDDNTKKTRLDTFIDDVLKFESRLANFTEELPPSLSPNDTNFRYTLRQLTHMLAQIKWFDFFKYMFNTNDITYDTVILLREKAYLFAVDDYIDSLGADRNRILNNYLTWRLAQSYSQDLSWEYVHANRLFYEARTGRTEFQGTWQYCFNLVSKKMADAVGALFIRSHFGDESKPQVHEIANYIKRAFTERLPKSEWMDKKTRTIAAEKLSAIVDKIGYPNYMLDDEKLDAIYKDLVVEKKGFFKNVLNINKFDRSLWNRKLKYGIDKTRWRLKTYDVHAAYYAYWNELLVPAGFLQSPVYTANLPKFMSFGSVGTVFAHEYINSIDAMGGYYYPNGSFGDWWTPKTTKMFLTERVCILNYLRKVNYTVQYNGRNIVFPLKANFYWNEAIAEIGGIINGYYAYKDWIKDNGKELLTPAVELTNEQAFFVAYAQNNCNSRTELTNLWRALRGKVPEHVRVNTALAHVGEFQEAFKCPANNKMSATPRCNVF